MGIHYIPTDKNLCWLMNTTGVQVMKCQGKKARGGIGKNRSVVRTAHLGPFSVI